VLAACVLAARGLAAGSMRGLALAGVAAALGGSIHPVIVLGSAPGLLLLTRRAAARPAALLVAAGFGGFAVLQYAWLPLRSAALPAIDFGAPRTLARLLYTMRGAAYSGSFQPSVETIWANLVDHGSLFVSMLGIGVLGLACIGLFSGLAGRRRRVAAAGVALAGGGCAPTVLQSVFRPDNPDVLGYLLPVFATVCFAAGCGAAALLARTRGRARTAAAAALFGVAASPALRLDGVDARGLLLPHLAGALTLDGVPPGSSVLLGGDTWVFPALYARFHEGRRADVSPFGLQMTEGDTLRSAAARDLPLPDIPASALQDIEHASAAGRPDALVQAIARGGPTFLNEVLGPANLIAVPAGWLRDVSPGRRKRDDDGAWTTVLGPALQNGLLAGDPVGRDAFARRYAIRGGAARIAGDPGAPTLLARGSALAANPWALVHLARHRLETGRDVPGTDPAGARFASAAARLRVGDVGGAREDVEAGSAIDPTHPMAFMLGDRLYALGAPPRSGGAP
jgi:hypothetical protein